MKSFLRAAFNITWFQILMAIFMSSFKYLLISFGLIGKVEKPFLFILATTIILLFLAICIGGIIEKSGESFETWTERNKASGKNKFLITFIQWSQIIPLVMGYIMVIYQLTFPPIVFFLALLCMLVIKNIINFFSKKETVSSEKV